MRSLHFIMALLGEVARFLMAGALVGQNAALMYFLVNHALPDSAKDLQMALLNGSGMLAGAAVNHYFGASARASSQGKPT